MSWTGTWIMSNFGQILKLHLFQSNNDISDNAPKHFFPRMSTHCLTCLRKCHNGVMIMTSTRYSYGNYHHMLSQRRTCGMTSWDPSPRTDQPPVRVWSAFPFWNGAASPKKDCMVSIRLCQGRCASLSERVYTQQKIWIYEFYARQLTFKVLLRFPWKDVLISFTIKSWNRLSIT